MDALRRSVQAESGGQTSRATGKKGRKKIEGQKEMLLPIPGKKTAREEHGKTTRATGKHRKAG
jgi:DNA end-binding protein Ku